MNYIQGGTIQSTTIYPLRNGDNLIVPFCRLSITNSSFIPSTVKEWNKLDIAIRKLDSLSKFKNAIRLNSQSNKISVPKLYYYGPRKLNVILTQIRCTASFLNHDLHKVHILSSPACSCGAPQEDANHFFFCLYQIFWNKKWTVSQHKRYVSIDQYFTSHFRKWNIKLCR